MVRHITCQRKCIEINIDKRVTHADRNSEIAARPLVRLLASVNTTAAATSEKDPNYILRQRARERECEANLGVGAEWNVFAGLCRSHFNAIQSIILVEPLALRVTPLPSHSGLPDTSCNLAWMKAARTQTY